MSCSCPQVKTSGIRHQAELCLPALHGEDWSRHLCLGLACCFVEVYLDYFSCRVFGTSRVFDSVLEAKAAV